MKLERHAEMEMSLQQILYENETLVAVPELH